MSAKHFNCFDDYENVVLECHKCHWKGTFEQGSVEYYAELMDCSCPKCNLFDAPILAIVSNPTLEELRANSDRPGIRELVQKIDRGIDEFEAQKLRTPEQLPEIGEDNFNLIWDEYYERTLIKHGDVVIFSEPARWEESRRFKEVAEILKAKYGDRIKDLVPTERSKFNLYGDDGKSPGFVDNVRAWFFGATTTPREGTWSGKKPAAPAASVSETTKTPTPKVTETN